MTNNDCLHGYPNSDTGTHFGTSQPSQNVGTLKVIIFFKTVNNMKENKEAGNCSRLRMIKEK